MKLKKLFLFLVSVLIVLGISTTTNAYISINYHSPYPVNEVEDGWTRHDYSELDLFDNSSLPVFSISWIEDYGSCYTLSPNEYAGFFTDSNKIRVYSYNMNSYDGIIEIDDQKYPLSTYARYDRSDCIFEKLDLNPGLHKVKIYSTSNTIDLCFIDLSNNASLSSNILTLNTTNSKMVEGSKNKLSPNLYSFNKTSSDITWKSDNESIATVDNTGTVTAVKKGQATITASINGTNVESSCSINVVSKEDVVNIPDDTFRNVIINKLNKTSDYIITKDDLINIDSLDISNKQVKSIEGIEFCSNLKSLDLSNTEVTNLAPILNLKNLTSLKWSLNK